MRSALRVTLWSGFQAFFALTIHAANLDVDNANASAYAGGWDNTFPVYSLDGSVGSGNGFGGWQLTANPNAAIRIESVSSLGGGNTLLDTAGKSFRLSGGYYTTDGGATYQQAYANAVRWIDPSGLDVGQSFTFQMAVNWRNGAKGVNLYDTAGNKVFNFNIGGDDYVVNNTLLGNGSIGNAYSNNTIFDLRFDQTSLTGGNWTITRSGGVSDLDTGTYSGTLRRFGFYAGGSGTNGNNDALFFNSLAVVPEPSVGSLFLGGLGLLALRRRFFSSASS